ncbi:MAG: TolC family protein [Sphingobacteriaceae bacterium]|jgi:outer membrane protein TolC|nr:TolC family protein [Sphingobacteriaceae bacterium]
MRIKHIIFFIALWLVNTNVFGQELLNLQDAINIALNNNYDIKLVKNDVEISKNNVNLGNAGILPAAVGSFSTGGSRQNTIQTQSTGTQRITDGVKNSNMSYGVGLDWTIFDGFKMFANLDRLKALEQQGQISLKSRILTTISDVINAYYTIAKQQQLVAASDSAMDISNLRMTIANNKLEIGKGSKLDVLAAKVDYNSDTSSYLQQKNLLGIYIVNLNQLLARDPNVKFIVQNQIDIDKNLIYSSLVEQSASLNPDLQNAFINKKIADLNLKQIKADRYPKVSLNSGYEFNRSTSPTGFNTSFKANGLTYGLTASLNIFNGFLQRQNERNAKIGISSSELSLNKVKQEVISQLATTYQNYSTYLELVKLERKNIEIAKQNLDITLEKYRLGSITPIILREAQKNAIDANSRYVEMQFQAKLAEIALKELSGTLNIQ